MIPASNPPAEQLNLTVPCRPGSAANLADPRVSHPDLGSQYFFYRANTRPTRCLTANERSHSIPDPLKTPSAERGSDFHRTGPVPRDLRQRVTAHKSPPARAGGTAGRWAAQPPIPTEPSPPTRPNRVHHQPARTCSQPTPSRGFPAPGGSLGGVHLAQAQGKPVFHAPSSWKRVQAPRFARSQSPFP